MALAGLMELGHALGDPLLLAADRFRIIAARNTGPQRIGHAHARFEQVGAAAVDLRVFLVPEDVAAFGVQKHDALRQQIDRLAQPLVRFASLGHRRFRRGALAHHLGDVGGNPPVLPLPLGLRRRLANRLERAAGVAR